MMKKTYQNPNITVIRINVTNALLQNSQLRVGDPVSSASGAEGRRDYNFDEDEEDY